MQKNFQATKGGKMEVEEEEQSIPPQSILKSQNFKSVNQKKALQTKDMNSMTYQSGAQSSIYLDTEDKTFLFQRNGELFQLDDAYQFIKMQESITLCIRYIDRFKHQMEIYGPKNNLLYVKIIESDNSSYYIDLDEEIFKWIDFDDDVMRVLAFRLTQDKKDILLELKNVLAHESTIEKRLEAGENNKQSPSSIHCSAVKTNLFEKYEEEFTQQIQLQKDDEYDWALSEASKSKYCLIGDEEVSERPEEFIDEIEEEEGEEVLEYKQIYTYHETEETMGYENNSISQSKLLDRLFVSRGPVISVFKADDSLKV